jgi:uncharacterized membrane protein YkvA (DUF1232 family)
VSSPLLLIDPVNIASLKARARELKPEVAALYFAARHPRTPWVAKLLVIAIVAYAVSPIDLIPDFIPVLGFLDELILLPIAIVLATKLVPADVLRECRERAVNAGRAGSRAGRVAAACIVLLWLALIVLTIAWMRSAL